LTAAGKVALTYFAHIAEEYDRLPLLNIFLKAKSVDRVSRVSEATGVKNGNLFLGFRV
jgi:hypothetical protein